MTQPLPFARFAALRPRLHRNPLPVQFWLWGLDARYGDLLARGFQKSPAQIGSSFYTLDNFRLHSSGLWLSLPVGELYYWRSEESFSLGGQHLPRLDGLSLVRPFVHSYEDWLSEQRGPHYRAELLGGKLPQRIRRLKPTWQNWIDERLLGRPLAEMNTRYALAGD